MGEHRLNSPIDAADYRIDDTDGMWFLLKERQTNLAKIDAHQIVVNTSVWGRLDSVGEVLRSPAVFELFDLSGVVEIPAIFAGEVAEKIELYGASRADDVAGVIEAQVR
jgi:hypothetical protein